MGPRNRFQGMNSASLCSLPGRYDNPIPALFLAPTDCLKIPAQDWRETNLASVGKPSWIPIIEAELGGDEEQVES
jgi:hypothetical protein